MAPEQLTAESLNKEIEELKNHYPNFKEPDLFTMWFLRAYLIGNDQNAAEAITNGPNEKDLDALFIDDTARTIFAIQTKYRTKLNGKAENRSDIITFAQFAGNLICDQESIFRDYIEGIDSFVVDKIKKARKKILKDDYRLRLFYVTTGKCSLALKNEATKVVRRTKDADIEIIDGKRIMILMRDYLDGVAPPIPTLDLEMESGAGVKVNGVLQRYDVRSEIESWVFSMKGDAIANIFDYAGVRLFARNIRGFLGNTEVNRGMETTIETEPDRFFYYNNGITIICDEAQKYGHKGRDVLKVSNPQIINGQQTTRMLGVVKKNIAKASVIVKVIKVPRDGNGENKEFDALVSRIVAGTNWQNTIRPSDLMANDRIQVEIEREFRRLRYLYLRKRQSKSEAKKDAGGKYFFAISKEDLAKAVAGCDLDPIVARSGKEKLFENKLYSHIFPNSDPNFYLPRYWLMKEATYCSKGYPERAYAKWMVLGFLWSQLAPIVKSAKNARIFREMCEKQVDDLVIPLNRAIHKVFDASTKYYRKNRGSGDKAQDPSSFFRGKRGRDKEFASFWNSAQNKTRANFDKFWKKVEAAIKL